MNSINFIQCFSVHSAVINILPFISLISGNLRNRWLLKMQNKAKFKTTQIPVTSLMLSTNKNAFQTPQLKNKAKQTQIKDAAALNSSLSAASESCFYVTPASSRQVVIPAKAQPRAGIYLISHPDSSGFRIFDICALIFDMLFMTNKPNLKKVKIITTCCE